MRIQSFVVLVILLMLCDSLLQNAKAGSLTVGSKVVYPGGVGQQPKEKDTGVKLNAEPVSAAIQSEEEDNALPSIDEMLELLEEKNTHEILELTSNSREPVALAFRSLAFLIEGNEKEAQEHAKQAIKAKSLPKKLKKLLEEKFPSLICTESDQQ